MTGGKQCALDQKKCVPCEGGVMALTASEAKAMLGQVPGWEFANDGKAIKRRFKFKNFKAAIAFVNKVGEIAESEGHHPDIMLGWGYAEFLMWTHAIGGLHENDFVMASKINALSGAI
jgi:4a-hydroxytetrahydrobiopterin dehydratase